ncbi:MAG: hypothetical protein WD066_09440 [Planctomycetaceae bacterium]
MTATLNEELRRAVEQQKGRPVEVVDPRTDRVYVLISREQYDSLKPLFESDPVGIEEQRDLLRRAGRRAGWDDPEMDAYDRYDEARAEPS